jgi:poly(3-hydroxybutyrate) depolymerase
MILAVCLYLASGAASNDPIQIVEGLIAPGARSSRSVIRLDPVEEAVVRGRFRPPAEGDSVGEGRWQRVEARADGTFQISQGSAYLYFSVHAPKERTMLLEAPGAGVVYVNGEPRAGDPYSTGYVSLPVRLRAGRNDLLIAAGRRGLRVRLLEPPRAISFDLRDPTLPDLRMGDRNALWGAVVVRNATDRPLRDAEIEAGGLSTLVPEVPAMSVRKVGFRLPPDEPRPELKLRRREQVLDETTLELRVREPHETYRQTFVSDIDGSVQYYGVNPSFRPGPGQALFLSLHGASVEAIGQADAYAAKGWGYLVAPTNRRPFGFDWEEIGRLDALEVLEDAGRRLDTDPRRVYLTGHSMGGHGTCQLGAHYPGLFAAVAPSAGWISFWTYGGGHAYRLDDPIEALLRRASNPSDTLLLKDNFRGQGVYILHGDADETVPVREARAMREALAQLPVDLHYHEEPGAGHWWDSLPEPGAACVDWPGFFDLFARRRLPRSEEVREVDFTTVSPGISAGRDWLTIEQQLVPLAPSRVQIRKDPHRRAFLGVTENVAALTLDASTLAGTGPASVELDGVKLEAEGGPIALRRIGSDWTVDPIRSSEKNAARYGGFKDVFRNRVLFVYGTGGSAEEQAWARAKARYDAETFWVRGNGAVDVIADRDFDPAQDRDRNVLLYGNSRTNTAWAPLLGESPVQVSPGRLQVGERSVTGDDLAVFFIRPRPGSERASVGAVSGTGIAGMRLTDRTPVFVSGAAFPDLLAFGPEMLLRGGEGIRVAGFFEMDWRVGGDSRIR